MAGFYRSGYTTVMGEAKVMASTQFEALDARRCFPCWDEPARKAVFQVGQPAAFEFWLYPSLLLFLAKYAYKM